MALEPSYTVALTFAAEMLQFRHDMGWLPLTEDDRTMCLDLTRRALANANGDPEVLAHSGWTLANVGREYDRGLQLTRIALEAIWAAKLRSFMTVLGNIVAVTSIIAVVSLIQGLNASVKQAILNQAGADSFLIQQYPITRSDEEFDKVRSNPRITAADARAVKRYSELATAVMMDSSGQGRITYRDRSIDSTRIQGVTGDYINFSSFDAERGRMMSPTEVDTARPVTIIGWRTADRLFGESVDPIDKTT